VAELSCLCEAPQKAAVKGDKAAKGGKGGKPATATKASSAPSSSAAAAPAAAPAAARAATPAAAKPTAKARKLGYKEQLEYTKLTGDMAELQAQASRAEKQVRAGVCVGGGWGGGGRGLVCRCCRCCGAARCAHSCPVCAPSPALRCGAVGLPAWGRRAALLTAAAGCCCWARLQVVELSQKGDVGGASAASSKLGALTGQLEEMGLRWLVLAELAGDL
jgi:hypothetical protein